MKQLSILVVIGVVVVAALGQPASDQNSPERFIEREVLGPWHAERDDGKDPRDGGKDPREGGKDPRDKDPRDEIRPRAVKKVEMERRLAIRANQQLEHARKMQMKHLFAKRVGKQARLNKIVAMERRVAMMAGKPIRPEPKNQN